MRLVKVSLADLKTCLGDYIIRIEGRTEDVYVNNLADVAHTNDMTLDWVKQSEKEQTIAESSMARVLLVSPSVIYTEAMLKAEKTLIVVPNPKVALAKVGNTYFVEVIQHSIHPTAVIHPDAIIGKNVNIGPHTTIGRAVIGDNTFVSASVTLYDNVKVGSDCFIKEGSVIGGAGFGFEIDENGNRFRFPQIGGVIIGNNVEIGANTCIDRGALSDTIIDDYAKIDNLCHIAHNVRIGKNAMITACSEISGSCVLGDNVWTGPNTSVRDGRTIAENTVIGIGAVVVKNVPANDVWAGNPAKSFKK